MSKVGGGIRDGRGFDALLVWLALGYLLVFSAFPLVYNVIMSLQEVDLFSLASFDRPFVGLQNYRDVLGEPERRGRSSATPSIFVVLSVACQLDDRLRRWRCSSSSTSPAPPGCAGCSSPGGSCRRWWSAASGASSSPATSAS